MTRTELLSRISINPNICFGKPCYSRTSHLGLSHSGFP